VRIAIVSDIHSNLEALEAVLKDAGRKRVDRIYCLGDIVGYGPNPKRVLDLAERFEFIVQGNHDEAVATRIPKKFKELAAKAAFWTRRVLKPKVDRSTKAQRRRWRLLSSLPATVDLGDALFAHGTPAHNFDYLSEPEIATEVYRRYMKRKRVLFVGHTHVPGVFVDGKGGDVRWYDAEPGMRYRIGTERVIVNVGSVGQPRDGDPRACYVVFYDDGSFRFRRVEYDIEKTAQKIYRKRELVNSLGDRLFEGE